MTTDKDYFDYRFSGIERLYGSSQMEVLKNAHVCIVGLGGVGSWAVEALVRSGIGEISLVDFDDLCSSNMNRQIHALDSTVGKLKSEALKKRILDINKLCKVHVVDKAFSKENSNEILETHFDFVIDAIDVSLVKGDLAVACRERNIPSLIVGSAGGRRDPSKIHIADLSKTHEDPMLHILRRDLRRQGFPRGKEKFNLPAIFSSEKVSYFLEGEMTLEKPDKFLKPLDCQQGLGTATFITGTFGFMAAHVTIEEILKGTC